jgi:hypothetical protein
MSDPADDSLPSDPNLPLAFELPLQDQLAVIRKGWSEDMRTLRSAGITKADADGLDMANLAAEIRAERMKVDIPRSAGVTHRWLDGRVIRSWQPFGG